MEFKDRLKKYRADNNLTQEELAQKLCVSRQAVSKYETGLNYPNLDVMADISKLLGISLDELLSKEEIAKETINANVNRRKNKRNIVLLIVVIAAVIAISVTAIVLAVKSAVDAVDDGYEIMGLVGTLNSGEAPTVQLLEEGKLFGYCYTYVDGKMFGNSYNLSDMHTSIVVTDSADEYNFDMNVIVSATENECFLYAVYYDKESREYFFEPVFITVNVDEVSRVRLNSQRRSMVFDLHFKRIDVLDEITLYEYGLNATLLNSIKFNGQESYSVSDDCLYIVMEQRFTDADGNVYNSFDIVLSSQIDKVLFYPIPVLNSNGYGTTSLALRKQ